MTFIIALLLTAAVSAGASWHLTRKHMFKLLAAVRRQHREQLAAVETRQATATRQVGQLQGELTQARDELRRARQLRDVLVTRDQDISEANGPVITGGFKDTIVEFKETSVEEDHGFRRTRAQPRRQKSPSPF